VGGCVPIKYVFVESQKGTLTAHPKTAHDIEENTNIEARTAIKSLNFFLGEF
jgi:hypothetical protein